MSYPVVIFWGLLVAGLFSRGPLLLFVFFGCWPFGAFAAIPPEATGGVTLTPAWIAAVCVFGKILLEEGLDRVLKTLFDFRRVGLLTLCGIYGLISALMFPRLFEGVAEVIPMRIEPYQRPIGVTPTTANLTQTVYFLITVTTVAAAYLLCLRPNKLRESMNALLFGGAVAIATGLADLVLSSVGLSSLLAPFRTATYALLTDSEVLNMKRVVGLTPEASSYAAICMTFLAPVLLLRSAYRTAFTRNFTVPLVVALLTLMIILSTSSTGYVGLAILGVTVAGHWAWMATRGRGEAGTSVVVVWIGAVFLLALIAARPELLEFPVNLFTEMVLKKTTTDSFAERSMWNEVSLKAFFDTWGLGVGLGSARASSWPVSVLANIGVAGALLLGGFLIHIMRSRPLHPRDEDSLMTVGLKFGFVPGLIMGSMSATSVNLGFSNSWMFGIIGALCWPPLTQKAAKVSQAMRSRPAPPALARNAGRISGQARRRAVSQADGKAPD